MKRCVLQVSASSLWLAGWCDHVDHLDGVELVIVGKDDEVWLRRGSDKAGDKDDVRVVTSPPSDASPFVQLMVKDVIRLALNSNHAKATLEVKAHHQVLPPEKKGASSPNEKVQAPVDVLEESLRTMNLKLSKSVGDWESDAGVQSSVDALIEKDDDPRAASLPTATQSKVNESGTSASAEADTSSDESTTLVQLARKSPTSGSESNDSWDKMELSSSNESRSKKAFKIASDAGSSVSRAWTPERSFIDGSVIDGSIYQGRGAVTSPAISLDDAANVRKGRVAFEPFEPATGSKSSEDILDDHWQGPLFRAGEEVAEILAGIDDRQDGAVNQVSGNSIAYISEELPFDQASSASQYRDRYHSRATNESTSHESWVDNRRRARLHVLVR